MSERSDLIETLRRHRGFLLYTAQGLTEEQGHTESTVSTLTIASLLKHVADTEEQWMAFAVGDESAFGVVDTSDATADDVSGWVDERFTLSEHETLDVLRARIDESAARTEEVLLSADLDQQRQLPEAPWFEPGASWSVRRIALHLIAEISQHAGHADIIRESLDSQKTMG